MYEQFYGMTGKPFSMAPDPAFLFLGKRHGTALTMLEYGLMNGAGISVLTGEVGAGKTTLVRRLLDIAGEDVVVGLISNTHRSFGNLLQWISVAFDLDAESDAKPVLYDQFTEFLIEQFSAGRKTVVIVDEAQNLDQESLEELRLLTNINSDGNELLQLVLVGQPELREQLRDPALRQLVQRIGVDYHLAPLAPEEVDDYIAHRLETVGADAAIFSAPARRLVAYLCGGVPRRVNAMCDTALVYGFAEGQETISAEMIRDIAAERVESGLYGAGLVQEDVAGGLAGIEEHYARVQQECAADNEDTPQESAGGHT